MTIIATNAGPSQLVQIARIHEDRGQWLDAAETWHRASLMTQPWNPRMAAEQAANAERCLEEAVR